MKNISFYLLAVVCVLLFSSCEDPDSSPRALLNVILVDNPAKWDSVFVEIEGVDIEVLVSGRESQSQTFYLEYKSGNKRIKISDLVAGTALLIGRNELPVGQIISAKIILGENHSMFFDEKRYVLEFADPADKEILLSTSINIQQGISYDIILDMDLEKSIKQVTETPLTYELEPTFKLVSGAGTVELSGKLRPTTLYPAIFLTSAVDTFSTHINGSGNYLFRVPNGKYDVYMSPKDELYQDTTFTLDLTAGLDSVIKDISFKLKP